MVHRSLMSGLPFLRRTAGCMSSKPCLHSWSQEMSSDYNLQLETFVHLPFSFHIIAAEEHFFAWILCSMDELVFE